MGKLILVGSTLTMCMIGTGAAAHVNWFVERDAEPLASFNVSDPIFMIWLCLAFMMVLFSVWLDGKLPTLRIADTKLRHDFMEILRVFTGMSFLLTAYEGSLVAPHKVADGTFGFLLVITQAVIGIMLIANRWIKVAAISMLALHAGVAVKFGILAALEYAIIIGIACFLLLNSIEDEKRRELFKPYSVDVLRIWTGISLVALAFGEKLAPSSLGQVFVAQYQWNFLQALGFTFFDDRLFVLSAGMVEAVIGIVLILGTTVRLAVLALSVMMAISNVVFILQCNNEAALVEFIGHMPIIGIALLLLGYGQRLKITDAFLSPRARLKSS
ncbi:hypothetical protein GV827_17925 [Sulfitobacter sp. JBTF-M27]|uniref:DoxX family membrane protein n=1 Tax=Sulfitobacter sediminilitoris TaxID=2698830 RepID=A0A6P0CEE0_9RHOB|nr:hypothetical protein [Sulfitobacter sediminilitoris]NEK24267.1 hypothetical protein [Sulfitobacter sediminilitoris]